MFNLFKRKSNSRTEADVERAMMIGKKPRLVLPYKTMSTEATVPPAPTSGYEPTPVAPMTYLEIETAFAKEMQHDPRAWTLLEPAAAAAAFAERLPADLDPITKAAAVSLVRASLSLLAGMGAKMVPMMVPTGTPDEYKTIHEFFAPRSAESLGKVVGLKMAGINAISQAAVSVLGEIQDDEELGERARLLEDSLGFFTYNYRQIFPFNKYGAIQLAKVRTLIYDLLWDAQIAYREQENRFASATKTRNERRAYAEKEARKL